MRVSTSPHFDLRFGYQNGDLVTHNERGAEQRSPATPAGTVLELSSVNGQWFVIRVAGNVEIWDAASSRCVRTLPPNNRVHLSPDARIMAELQPEQVVFAEVDSSGNHISQLEGVIRRGDFFPDSRRFLGIGQKSLHVFDVVSGKNVACCDLGELFAERGRAFGVQATISPDGKTNPGLA